MALWVRARRGQRLDKWMQAAFRFVVVSHGSADNIRLDWLGVGGRPARFNMLGRIGVIRPRIHELARISVSAKEERGCSGWFFGGGGGG
ncbi:hypothetical protein ACLB2K_044784 [Fragaria x ananassa]